MCAGGTAEGAAGVGDEREFRGFDWHGFFRNPNVMVQAFLYALLFYKTTPSPREQACSCLLGVLSAVCANECAEPNGNPFAEGVGGQAREEGLTISLYFGTLGVLPCKGTVWFGYS
ncbi:unnamed protein product [Urochloa humidicola]